MSVATQPLPNSPLEPEESAFSLRDLWIAIRKHKWMVGLAVTVGIAAAIVVSAAMTRIYEASSTVYFDPRPPQPLGEKVEPVIDTSADYWNRKEYYNTQNWILTSRATLEPVVLRLRLHMDRAFVKNNPGTAREDKPVVTVAEAAALLASRMKVLPVNESRLAKVTYRDADANRAAEVLNAILKVFIGKNEEELLSATTDAAAWLHGQVDVLKQDLETSEVALHDYKKDKNLLSVSLDDQSNMLREEIQQLNSALTAARARRQQVAARSAALAKVPEDNPADLPSRELLESPILQGLRSEFVNASRELEGLLGSGKGEAHPLAAAAGARKETTRQALLAEIRNVKQALAREVQAVDGEIGGLQRLFDGARDRALEINKLEIEYKRMRRSRDTNERLFTIVTERAKESDMARLMKVNNVRIIENALVPKSPVSPNTPLNILGGCAAGMVLGLAGAVARESMDRSIRDPEDAETSVRLPLLGLLPAAADGGAAYGYGRRRRRAKASADVSLDKLTHTSPSSTFAEAARSIRTSIAFSTPDKKVRSLLVTSAVAGDGKTTVASNVAISMAQAGDRVLLIDGDLRRARVHKAFSIPSGPGFSELLIGAVAMENAVVASEVPRLSLMPAGALPPNPSELLHSQAFTDLLERLKGSFDVVIIDSPPLVPVTDGAILAARLDAVILVARALRTSRSAARRAVRILADVGANTLGIVLNDFNAGTGRRGYYYREYGYTPELSDSAS